MSGLRTRRLVLATLLLASLAATAPAVGQRAAVLLSHDIRSADWGIGDWSAIRQGRLSVSRLPSGDELNVLALSAVAPPPAPDRFSGATPACDGNCFLVSSFDFGNSNALGGRFGAFSARPSVARAALDALDDGRRALTMDFTKAESGACGAWIHLFDFTRPPADRVYLDASPFSALAFWIRGRTGRERVVLKAADAAWERKEDALPIGEVAAFLPSGRIDQTWQRARVPLSAIPGRLKASELAVLVFEASGAGEGRVAIKDLSFCLKPDPLPGLSPAPRPAASPAPPAAKAIWVWNTAEILPDDAAQRALAEFCVGHGFTDLFLQLPNAPARLGPSGEVVLDAGRWAPLLARLHRAGLRSHALDGARHFALPEHHDRVLKTVDNVARYNASADAGARFDGVHLDIEPYLLPGFQGPRRGRILSDYLELVSGIAARARAAGMTVGVDIPFWYDSPDEFDGQRVLVDFKGRRAPASEHVLDLVDRVGLMDYRTVAYGADGFVGLAEGELQYAASRGKRVFLGLETTELPDEALVEFNGVPRRGPLEPPPGAHTIVFASGPSGATVSLIPPGGTLNPRASPGAPPHLWWPASRVVAVPAAKLTFARLGAGALHDAMRQSVEELRRYPSFAGFAIHDYLGYRALLDAAPPTR